MKLKHKKRDLKDHKEEKVMNGLHDDQVEEQKQQHQKLLTKSDSDSTSSEPAAVPEAAELNRSPDTHTIFFTFSSIQADGLNK